MDYFEDLALTPGGDSNIEILLHQQFPDIFPDPMNFDDKKPWYPKPIEKKDETPRKKASK